MMSWRIFSSAFVVTAMRSTRDASCRGFGGASESVNSLAENSRATSIDEGREWLNAQREVECVLCFSEPTLHREPFGCAKRMSSGTTLRDHLQLRVGGAFS